jgi:hypothetical protein
MSIIPGISRSRDPREIHAHIISHISLLGPSQSLGPATRGPAFLLLWWLL